MLFISVFFGSPEIGSFKNQQFELLQKGDFLLIKNKINKRTFFVQYNKAFKMPAKKEIYGTLKMNPNGLILVDMKGSPYSFTNSSLTLSHKLNLNLDIYDASVMRASPFSENEVVGIGVIDGDGGFVELSCKCKNTASSCDVGGPDSSECGANQGANVDANVVSGGGGKSCSVSCKSGYFACCNY